MPRSAAGDRAEQRAGEPGQADRDDQREQRRQPEAGRRVDAELVLAGEVRVAVGADGDEERVRERQLAGDARRGSSARSRAIAAAIANSPVCSQKLSR